MVAMSHTTAVVAQGAPRPSLSLRGTRALLLVLALVLARPTTATAAAAPAAPQAAAVHQETLAQADRAFHARRYARAATLYRRAAALDRRRGDAALMAAVAAFQIADYDQARRDLDRALAAELDPEDRELGSTYLSLLADASASDGDGDGPPASFTLGLATTLAAGLDSNPQQQGPAELAEETGGGRSSAPFASATVDISLDGSLAGDLELEVAYSLEQAAYGDRRLAQLDYQDHALSVALSTPLGRQVRLRFSAGSDLSLTGLGVGLVPFSRSGRADLDLQLGRQDIQLRLGAGYSATEILDPDLAFLSGQRFELRASPVITWRQWRASFTGRWRQDQLGDWQEDEPAIEGGARVPYSNQARALLGRISGPEGWILRPAVSARLERRRYDQVALTGTGTGDAPMGERNTETAALGVSLRWRLSERATLTAQWDLRRQQTRFQPASTGVCAASTACDPESLGGRLADRHYQQQTLGLQLQIQWL